MPTSLLRTRSTAALRRSHARGYTAVEVLMAMTVMAIGAAAVMSMQKASIQGNLDARKTDVANSIARMWVERLRRDGMQWTLPSPANPGGNNFANAQLLNHVGAGWLNPTDYITATPPISPGFDILGREVTPASALAGAQFCVGVQLTYLVNDTANPQNNLIRADVRVLWLRGITYDVTTTLPAGVCAAAVAATPDPTVYHAIYATTAIRQNGAP